MKSQKELEELKQEVETVSRKLHELTDEELAQVSGGDEFASPNPLVQPAWMSGPLK